MQILRVGSRGVQVRHWQAFLVGQGQDPGGLDGIFGPGTEQATKAFQREAGLDQDGIVGNTTFGAAGLRGFELTTGPADEQDSPEWPPLPAARPLVGNAARAQVFGTFAYVAAPLSDNKENIRITDGWPAQNIVDVSIPQLAGVSGAPASLKVRFHRLAEGQLRNVWKAWDDAGLLSRVKTWHGSFVPRFVRGSTSTLSNHAYGSAFDINMKWNGLGQQPALVGEEGCVRELVEIANDHGFYWGGHFRNRRDGMHFEVAELR